MNATQPQAPQRRVWGMRLRLLIGFAAVVAAIGLLVARSAKNEMVYYITVTELLERGKGAEVGGLRVTGTVVPGSIRSEPMFLRFEMTDGTSSIPVEYRDIVPDTFGEKGEVVVEGSYRPDGTFQADFLMAKCPSKYEMSPDEEMPENMTRTSKSS